MIGNEISIQTEDQTNGYGRREKREKPMNIDMIKTLVSGGDSVEARRMRSAAARDVRWAQGQKW